MRVPPTPDPTACGLCGRSSGFVLGIGILSVLLATLACGSGRSTSDVPTSNWSDSLNAAKLARRIETTFREGGNPDRVSAEGEIDQFIKRYPRDPNCVTMQLRLAWIRLYQMRLEEARSILTTTGTPIGSVDRDYATILRGALLRREGRATEALELLLTLDGKLVDSSLRDLFCEEAIRAALEVARFGTAVYLMTVWRATGSEDRMPTTEEQIESNLAKIPAARLSRLLTELNEQSQRPVADPTVKQARGWVLEHLRARMAFEALSRKDPEMAQSALVLAPTKFLRSSTGEQLRRLSETAITQTHSIQAAIGLLLEMQDDTASRRSAELVTGAMRALDESQSLSQVRLISREIRATTASEIDVGLKSLVAGGAAIVIAGVTSATHAAAARLSVDEPTLVVSLSGNADEPLAKRFFQVEAPSEIALRVVNRKGESPSLVVTRESPWCTASDAFGRNGSEKLNESQPLFVADDDCARRVAVRLREGSHASSVLLGPEAVSASDRFERVTVLTSPRFGSKHPIPVALSWQTRFRRIPYWYEALGYDVVRLSANALKVIGSDVVSGDAAISAVLERVSAELASVQSELLTSSDRGFGPRHLLSPVLETISDLPGVELQAEP